MEVIGGSIEFSGFFPFCSRHRQKASAFHTISPPLFIFLANRKTSPPQRQNVALSLSIPRALRGFKNYTSLHSSKILRLTNKPSIGPWLLGDDSNCAYESVNAITLASSRLILSPYSMVVPQWVSVGFFRFDISPMDPKIQNPNACIQLTSAKLTLCPWWCHSEDRCCRCKPCSPQSEKRGR